VEEMVEVSAFWKNRKVLVTGHTGFKGSWMCLVLQQLGAEVQGFSLEPPTPTSLYKEASVGDDMLDLRCDIRDRSAVKAIFKKCKPEFVFHLAAQPLVRYSYINPVETYETNFMGTLNILEAIRYTNSVSTAVIITTDKCYENKERVEGYKENEAMGGYDPYSSSKGAAELLISSYRNSYFKGSDNNEREIGLASARAGNVIGGGDWAQDRLIPDIINSIVKKKKILIRNPHAIRPWQHVLEPVFGYLRLAECLSLGPSEYSEGWNFGPNQDDARSVKWIVEKFLDIWGLENGWELEKNLSPHEAHYLKLDCSKSAERLKCLPLLSLEESLEMVSAWHKNFILGADMKEYCFQEIQTFMKKVNI
jgi:CDP-glucose 4,6-dehydratase